MMMNMNGWWWWWWWEMMMNNDEHSHPASSIFIHQQSLIHYLQSQNILPTWIGIISKQQLVGGFNPVEKYARQNRNLPQIGVNIKTYMKPPPRQSQTSATQKPPFSLRRNLLPLSRQSRNHGADLWRHSTTTAHGKRTYLSNKKIWSWHETSWNCWGQVGYEENWMISLSNSIQLTTCWWLVYFHHIFQESVGCIEVLHHFQRKLLCRK